MLINAAKEFKKNAALLAQSLILGAAFAGFGFSYLNGSKIYRKPEHEKRRCNGPGQP